MSVICYRLEHKNGDGLFFTKNGSFKTNPSIYFRNNLRYAFLNKNRFFEPSYINFYNNNDYILYKIIISKYYIKNQFNQIIFDISDIIKKYPIMKEGSD